MGIFSRFRDIINSNINAMLEKAEDPEKLIKLMIQEMEDTLVEIKASCAGAMASRARVNRSLEEARRRSENWTAKAKLAVSKGRDDLAREALLEKKRYDSEVASLEREAEQFSGVIDKYKDDIQQLEEKLESARNKHRVLVQRHLQAQNRKKTRSTIRHAETSDAFTRFEQVENRIERIEAEADLTDYGRKPTLEEELSDLEKDEEIEKELEALKKSVSGDKGEKSE